MEPNRILLTKGLTDSVILSPELLTESLGLTKENAAAVLAAIIWVETIEEISLKGLKYQEKRNFFLKKGFGGPIIDFFPGQLIILVPNFGFDCYIGGDLVFPYFVLVRTGEVNKLIIESLSKQWFFEEEPVLLVSGFLDKYKKFGVKLVSRELKMKTSLDSLFSGTMTNCFCFSPYL
jgi:hypothetical protein